MVVNYLAELLFHACVAKPLLDQNLLFHTTTPKFEVFDGNNNGSKLKIMLEKHRDRMGKSGSCEVAQLALVLTRSLGALAATLFTVIRKLSLMFAVEEKPYTHRNRDN